MTKLILIRHGESLGNKQNIFLGHEDMDLSPKGYKQAALAAEALKNIHIDAIYSSDLQRAYHTAQPTAASHGLDVIRDNHLREINAGDWDGMGFEELKYKADYKLWLSDVGHAHCTGGESVAELWERIHSCIRTIAEENDGKTVLIATHATPIRTLVTGWSGKTIDDMKDVPWVGNASLTYANYTDGKFTLTKVNDVAHLKDLATTLPKNV